MKTSNPTTQLILITLSLLFSTAVSAQSEHEDKDYPTLQGPRYSVNIKAGTPEIMWDNVLAPERLFTTSDTVGFLVDDEGQPKLLLTWGEHFDDLDAAYTSKKYFSWAFEQVSKGSPWHKPGEESGYKIKEDSPKWNGNEWVHPNRPEKDATDDTSMALEKPRVVRITQPNHVLVFTLTAAGISATDNGKPVEVVGDNGNYRVYSDEYEAGVAFRQNGKTYQYYKPL